mgnify:CR=1 FL=1
MSERQIIFKESLPCKTRSLNNSREHWAAKSKRAKNERNLARFVFAKHEPPKPMPSDSGKVIFVKMTRVSPRKLDCDNLTGALKAIRDGIADWLMIDDGLSCVSWEYGQKKAGVREHSVDVEVGVKSA